MKSRHTNLYVGWLACGKLEIICCFTMLVRSECSAALIVLLYKLVMFSNTMHVFPVKKRKPLQPNCSQNPPVAVTLSLISQTCNIVQYKQQNVPRYTLHIHIKHWQVSACTSAVGRLPQWQQQDESGRDGQHFVAAPCYQASHSSTQQPLHIDTGSWTFRHPAHK